MNFLKPNDFLALKAEFQKIFDEFQITEVMVKELPRGRGLTLYVQSTSPGSENIIKIQEACSNLLSERNFYDVNILSLTILGQRVRPRDAISYAEFLNRHNPIQPAAEIRNAGEPVFSIPSLEAGNKNKNDSLVDRLADLPKDLHAPVLKSLQYDVLSQVNHFFNDLTNNLIINKAIQFVSKGYSVKDTKKLENAGSLFFKNFPWNELESILFPKKMPRSLLIQAGKLDNLIRKEALAMVGKLSLEMNDVEVIYELYSCMLAEKYLHTNAINRHLNSENYNLLHYFAVLPLTSTPKPNLAFNYLLQEGGWAVKPLVESVAYKGVTPLNAGCLAQRSDVVNKLLSIIQINDLDLNGASPYLYAMLGYEIPNKKEELEEDSDYENNDSEDKMLASKTSSDEDSDNDSRYEDNDSDFDEVLDAAIVKNFEQILFQNSKIIHPNTFDYNQHQVLNQLKEFNIPNSLMKTQIAPFLLSDITSRDQVISEKRIYNLVLAEISEYRSNVNHADQFIAKNALDYIPFSQRNLKAAEDFAKQFENSDSWQDEQKDLFSDEKMKLWYKAVYHFTLAIDYSAKANQPSEVLAITLQLQPLFQDEYHLNFDESELSLLALSYARFAMTQYNPSKENVAKNLESACEIALWLADLYNNTVASDEDWVKINQLLAVKYNDIAQALNLQRNKVLSLENKLDLFAIHTDYRLLVQKTSTSYNFDFQHYARRDSLLEVSQKTIEHLEKLVNLGLHEQKEIQHETATLVDNLQTVLSSLCKKGKSDISLRKNYYDLLTRARGHLNDLNSDPDQRIQFNEIERHMVAETSLMNSSAMIAQSLNQQSYNPFTAATMPVQYSSQEFGQIFQRTNFDFTGQTKPKINSTPTSFIDISSIVSGMKK